MKLKILGIERFMPANRPANPTKGECVGILLPAGTEIKRGDWLVASDVIRKNVGKKKPDIMNKMKFGN